MSNYADLLLPDDGKLAHNIAHFARALRKAGLPIGPGRVIDAIRAVEAVGFTGAKRLLLDAAMPASSAAPSIALSSRRCSACSGATRAIWNT